MNRVRQAMSKLAGRIAQRLDSDAEQTAARKAARKAAKAKVKQREEKARKKADPSAGLTVRKRVLVAVGAVVLGAWFVTMDVRSAPEATRSDADVRAGVRQATELLQITYDTQRAFQARQGRYAATLTELEAFDPELVLARRKAKDVDLISKAPLEGTALRLTTVAPDREPLDQVTFELLRSPSGAVVRVCDVGKDTRLGCVNGRWTAKK